MIGVTVGIGEPYHSLARVSAACFETFTGFPVKILGGKEQSAVSARHPAEVRLHLFDLIDEEEIVYFDADWFCLNPWNPGSLDANFLWACRDFVHKHEFPGQSYDFESLHFMEEAGEPITAASVRQDYVDEVLGFVELDTPPAGWINTGLLVLRRETHRQWLELARELYRGRVGHHEHYFEQPSLMRALEELRLPYRLLPRRLNVLAAFPARWPSQVIGLHVKAKRHAEFVSAAINRSVKNSADVTKFFLRSITIHES